MVWHPSICPSVCPKGCAPMTHQQVACDAASVHFGPPVRRTNTPVIVTLVILLLRLVCSVNRWFASHHDRLISYHPEERRSNRTLPRTYSELPESCSRRQHQLRCVRARPSDARRRDDVTWLVDWPSVSTGALNWRVPYLLCCCRGGLCCIPSSHQSLVYRFQWWVWMSNLHVILSYILAVASATLLHFFPRSCCYWRSLSLAPFSCYFQWG